MAGWGVERIWTSSRTDSESGESRRTTGVLPRGFTVCHLRYTGSRLDPDRQSPMHGGGPVPSSFTLLVDELRQRKVIRALFAYGAVAFAVLQAADILFAVLLLPDVAFTFLALACLAGLPIVAVLSWAYEMTVEGLKKAQDVPEHLRHGRVPLRVYAKPLGVFLAAGLLFTLTAGAVGRLRYPASDDGRVGMAVFPFRGVGESDPEWSEGAADLLATVLDGTPGLRVVDPWSLWRPLRDRADAPPTVPDPGEAQAITAEAGAHRFLLGSVVPSGDHVEVALRLYQIGRSEPIDAFSLRAEPEGISDVVRRAAVMILARVWGPLRPRDLPSELDFESTRSPEAMKAYLAAKEALRRGLVDSANVAIDRAIAIDSSFALALVEAVNIKSWYLASRGDLYQGFFELLDRAEPFLPEVNERTRLRARATRASVRTDGRTAIQAARHILEIDPLDYDANAKLEYFERILGWQLGLPRSGGRDLAERVVLMDSTQVPALVTRSWWAVALRDTSDMRVQLRRLRAVPRESPLSRGVAFALEAAVATDAEFQEMMLSAPGTLPEAIAAMGRLRMASPSRYGRFLEALRAAPNPTLAQLAWNESMRLDVARGRIGQVDSALHAQPAPREEQRRLAERFLIAADLAGVGDRATAPRAVETFSAGLPPDSALALFERRPVWWDGWLIGAWNAQSGDTTLARRWIRAMGTLPPGGTSEDYRGALQADMEARLARRRGNLQRALEQARSAFALWTIHTDNEFEHAPEPLMRLSLAHRYREAGLADSARAILSSLVPPTTWMGFLTARASFDLGELADAANRPGEAVGRYGLARDIWAEDGVASVDSLRAKARSRMEALRSGGL